MRVESIISINANQKHNPYTAESAGISTGKTNHGIAFADYLKANLQEASSTEVSGQTENQWLWTKNWLNCQMCRL